MSLAWIKRTSSSSMSSMNDANNITIRRYQHPTDRAQVQALFVKAQTSNIGPAVWGTFQRSKRLMALVTTSAVGAIATGVMAMKSSSKTTTTSTRQNQPQSRNQGSLVLLSILFSLTPLLSWVTVYAMIRKVYVQYTQEQVHQDLSCIPKVYVPPGLFLVAVDKNNNKIVGMVGAEYQNETTPSDGNNDDDDDDDNNNKKNEHVLYEIRRMAVDPTCKNQGIGKVLMKQLDYELDEQTLHRRMFLVTTTTHYAAQRLYTKCGYTLKKTYPMETSENVYNHSWMPFIFNSVMSLIYMEKEV